ncbi:ETC complex I subunit conserved region-domain-containing protein [Biscogniauxia marginata]|nr:ETC complex I subunit conserved region-domain-containing protein [Biscogniauxia marginata]
MRPTLRLLASVKPRYLQPGNPTGLTGLYTHGSPRSTLLYLYRLTLDKLGRIPESSLYRQSAEALTRHRLAVVEAAVPPGHREWAERHARLLDAHPDALQSQFGPAAAVRVAGGVAFAERPDPPNVDERYEEWDGEEQDLPADEGLRGRAERSDILRLQPRSKWTQGAVPEDEAWEPEPQMTADQVEEVERKIGGGLIEEVVQTAENELKLVDVMYDAKVWETLEEKPAEGQWTYFERHS